MAAPPVIGKWIQMANVCYLTSAVMWKFKLIAFDLVMLLLPFQKLLPSLLLSICLLCFADNFDACQNLFFSNMNCYFHRWPVINWRVPIRSWTWRNMSSFETEGTEHWHRVSKKGISIEGGMAPERLTAIHNFGKVSLTTEYTFHG